MCQRVGQLTDRKFQIQSFAGGEIVPPLQVWDATQNGTVECGHTLTSFNIGRNPAVAFDSGLALRTQYAPAAGLDELRRRLGAHPRVVQEGWNPAHSLRQCRRADGWLLSQGDQLGRRPQRAQVPDRRTRRHDPDEARRCAAADSHADIYPSLERGAIDAAEWIGPYDDEKLGLHKVARYYYYPGWWEGSAQVTLLVNLQHWEALPESYRAALEAACAEATVLMMAKYDTRNPEALRRLVAAGVQLRQFPRPVLDACYKAAFETYDELAGRTRISN
jgi:TRAP-type mannitol/chloroaromatic compound transport system, periplasmic component